jgi:parvulin-like peptidyl-prolyl isomerase
MYPATPSPTEVLTSTPAPTNTPDPASTATSTAAPATPTFLPQPATLTATPYTLDGYTERYGNSIDSIKSFDVSESTFRSVYENQIYSEKLLGEIAKDTPRTAEQVWARHILVDDQISLGIVRTLLDSGVDFAKVAKQYSKDTGSGANGGDLGWFEKGAMVAEFEQAAFSQEIGVIGKPVKSSFGYHIIQVLDRQELPLTASQYEQNKQTTFTDWLTKTREEATTAGTLTILDVWKENIPALPAAFSQLLQQ